MDGFSTEQPQEMNLNRWAFGDQPNMFPDAHTSMYNTPPTYSQSSYYIPTSSASYKTRQPSNFPRNPMTFDENLKENGKKYATDTTRTAPSLYERMTSIYAPAAMNPACAVCTKPASGVHFDVLACEGCKGFFRRSVTQKISPMCPNGRNCTRTFEGYITEGRLWCNHCRYRQCLEAGMNPERIGSRFLRDKSWIDKLKEMRRATGQ
ncbi:unnamed protein product [Caenorhabditis sp. 36 PRJEB53466]|nr:unnamed protein product [Caenorhabditis sp. 36 PRJEB53466]